MPQLRSYSPPGWCQLDTSRTSNLGSGDEFLWHCSMWPLQSADVKVVQTRRAVGSPAAPMAILPLSLEIDFHM